MYYRYLYSLFFLVILVATPSPTCAQSIDSLKLDTLIDVLTLQKEDVRTVNAYLSLSDEYVRVSEHTIGLTYADLAKELAHKISYKEGELEATLNMAHIYLNYHLDFKKSTNYYDEALQLAEELNSDEDKVRVYRGYSLVYTFVNDYQLAISFNQKAIEIAENMNDDQLISDLTAYGGSMYEESGDTAKALEMYQTVESIEAEHNFINTSFASLVMIAHYYFLEGDIERSLQMYRSAITKFERLHDYRWTSYGHAEIAKVHIADSNYDVAEKHALAGLELAHKFDLRKERADNYHSLSLIYKAKGDEIKHKKFQKAYTALLDSVIVDIDPREVGELNGIQEGSNNPYSQIKSLVVILILTGIVVFLAGIFRKKR